MTLNQLKTLYTNAPAWVQNIYASIPYALRNGAEFRQWYAFLNKEIDMEAYEILKLKETLYHAYEKVPYYRKLFDELQVSPLEIHSIKDLKDFPLLTKKIIRENFSDLQADYPKNKTFYLKTGGTTGDPISFYQSSNVWKKELAFVLHFFESYGYDNRDLKASFKGGDFENGAKDIYWKYEPLNRSISFSPIHLNAKTLRRYVDELNARKPLFFHSYPSTLIFLVQLMSEAGLSLDFDPKAIFLISEGYDDADIQTFQEFFGCPVTTFYGHTEHLFFATAQDKALQIYKPDRRYGMMEILDASSQPISSVGQEGTLVGTSFDNYAMPLIRYETDDRSFYLDRSHETIRNVKSLRTKVYLDAKNGAKISITFMSISALSDAIHAFQFYQEYPGKLSLLIVPKQNFTDADQKKILAALRDKIGEMMEIKVKLVDQLIRSKRGKSINVVKKYQ